MECHSVAYKSFVGVLRVCAACELSICQHGNDNRNKLLFSFSCFFLNRIPHLLNKSFIVIYKAVQQYFVSDLFLN